MKKLDLRFVQLCEDSPFPVPCLPTWRGFSCIHNFYVPGEPNNDWYTSIEHEDSLNTSVALFRSVAWSHDWHEAHRLRKIRSLSPFDDGRRNFHEFFFPLLKEFQVESTEAMMTAVDLLGFHVRLKTPDGTRGARIAFSQGAQCGGDSKSVGGNGATRAQAK
jgi:hypothetical protein